MSTAAEDTLKAKNKDNRIISGHLVAKALKNEGVGTLFTLFGGHIINIYNGCVSEGIRIVDVRHEQVAVHAADGDARHMGKGFSIAAKAVHPNKEAIAKTGNVQCQYLG